MNCRKSRRLLETFAIDRDLSVLAEDVVLRDQAQERSFRGREAVTSMLNTFFLHGFTAIRTDVQAMIVGQQEAALAFTFRGRQDGPFMGIPPTWQVVAVPMVIICQMEEDWIKRITLYYNAGTLLRQLGFV